MLGTVSAKHLKETTLKRQSDDLGQRPYHPPHADRARRDLENLGNPNTSGNQRKCKEINSKLILN